MYGLTGIPNSLVERIEIVKGPASSLYGSEAVGGIINIITKKAENAPTFSADVMSTTWSEHNIDLGFRMKAGKGISVLTGVNYYSFNETTDNNKDQFTDVPLQNRISVFQKWDFRRPENRLFSVAARYLYEDRWGGDIRWNRSYRGGNEIYGESIYTNRGKLFGAYQLPVRESMNLGFSFVNHDQDSRYGTLSYIANQKVAFGQLAWDRRFGKHDLLAGAAVRYTYYDDNTPATVNQSNTNQPEKVFLPGIFVQDEVKLNSSHSFLLGLRYDYNQSHGAILTPRFAYKWAPDEENILRFNAGTGFRVVNIFTEDHAALTGSRDILILTGLKPEQSYNANLNYTKKIYQESGKFINLEATAFYTYFTNRIVPDYETDFNKIIYDNLKGHAVSRGLSLNADLNHSSGVKLILGATLMDNTLTENDVRKHQLLTENFTGTWAISYRIRNSNLLLDYTGNVYSPMHLPLLGALDPRKLRSPWWSIQNMQITYDGLKKWEIYAGIKNLLNWTPNRGNPFLIARSHDPFDQYVVFDPSSQAVATPENPYALTFDPTYVYAPNQGIRGFMGVRFKLD